MKGNLLVGMTQNHKQKPGKKKRKCLFFYFLNNSKCFIYCDFKVKFVFFGTRILVIFFSNPSCHIVSAWFHRALEG